MQVTVIGDGVVLFSGWLGAGGSTDWYTAAQFEVTTSDGNLTLFENAATGQQFYMGFGPNETYYLGGLMPNRHLRPAVRPAPTAPT